jgi:hypothetical protein
MYGVFSQNKNPGRFIEKTPYICVAKQRAE